MADNQLESYNKGVSIGQGTLIGNWKEERDLREATGVGRTIVGSHFAKISKNMYNQCTDNVEMFKNLPVVNNTKERILGQELEPHFDNTNSIYGSVIDKAASISQKGRKQIAEELFINEYINNELAKQRQQETEQKNQRIFNTTTSDQFTKKENEVNTIGRRIMKDQNNNPLNLNNVDIQFKSEFGMIKKPPINSDDNLKHMLQEDGYVKQIPITFYTEKREDGVIYQSMDNKKTFGLNNTFIKQYPHYTHIKN